MALVPAARRRRRRPRLRPGRGGRRRPTSRRSPTPASVRPRPCRCGRRRRARRGGRSPPASAAGAVLVAALTAASPRTPAGCRHERARCGSAVALVAAGAVTAGGYVVAAPAGTSHRSMPSGRNRSPSSSTSSTAASCPSELVVEAGTEVRFVVRNGDPIGHELIVGPPDVHERHRHGTEAEHEPPRRRALGRSGRAGRHELRVRRARHGRDGLPPARPLRVRDARRDRGRRAGDVTRSLIGGGRRRVTEGRRRAGAACCATTRRSASSTSVACG